MSEQKTRKRSRKLIELETYKLKFSSSPRYGGGILTEPGASKKVKIDQDWLEDQIKPKTLEDFLLEYTYDDSFRLHKEYQEYRQRS